MTRPASPPLCIAIVGAESTGKSTLAATLAQRLPAAFGLRAMIVTEVLREWCDAAGRTPRVDEQLLIAAEQQRRIDDASAAAVDVVFCDTTPLMTAVYSQIVFGDDSIDAFAQRHHRRCDFTLLTAIDLPWVADGLQRDGPQVRAPVDALVRRMLHRAGGPWAVVRGRGPARADCAIEALGPLLRRRAGALAACADVPAPGRLPRLPDDSPVADPGSVPGPWCERCDAPGCEHALSARFARG